MQGQASVATSLCRPSQPGTARPLQLQACAWCAAGAQRGVFLLSLRRGCPTGSEAAFTRKPTASPASMRPGARGLPRSQHHGEPRLQTTLGAAARPVLDSRGRRFWRLSYARRLLHRQRTWLKTQNPGDGRAGSSVQTHPRVLDTLSSSAVAQTKFDAEAGGCFQPGIQRAGAGVARTTRLGSTGETHDLRGQAVTANPGPCLPADGYF